MSPQELIPYADPPEGGTRDLATHIFAARAHLHPLHARQLFLTLSRLS